MMRMTRWWWWFRHRRTADMIEGTSWWSMARPMHAILTRRGSRTKSRESLCHIDERMGGGRSKRAPSFWSSLPDSRNKGTKIHQNWHFTTFYSFQLNSTVEMLRKISNILLQNYYILDKIRYIVLDIIKQLIWLQLIFALQSCSVANPKLFQ
jgi:hypothetical protein